MKTLDTWLKYIDTVHGRKIDLNLERISCVAKRLKLLPFKPFTITVAGTNGKGSTSSLIAQTLTNAGYQVGSTLSPHLHRFNERIKVNMQEVSDASIIVAFELIEKAREDITLSYFEFNTLASLYIFNKSKVDVAVLEVGLGGEFDAVNIVDADLAVITNVALDHMDFLGSTREQIAQAKAGIIRDAIPVIYGESDLPKAISDSLEKHAAQGFHYGTDYVITRDDYGLCYKDLATQQHYNFSKAHILPCNVATAIKALSIISKQFPIEEAILKNTVENFTMAGRWQVIKDRFTYIYDVAHNPHSVAVLLDYLHQTPCGGRTYALFSMLNTKDMASVLTIIKPAIDAWFCAPLAQNRSYSKSEIEAHFNLSNVVNYQCVNSIPEALALAQSQLSNQDRLIVFGSFHTVAETQQLTV